MTSTTPRGLLLGDSLSFSLASLTVIGSNIGTRVAVAQIFTFAQFGTALASLSY
ncbi:MAG: hypothetical protein ABI551_13545 [Polyangiaceae bacterium]